MPSNDHIHINDNPNPTNKLTEISVLLNIHQIKKIATCENSSFKHIMTSHTSDS
jgi:hypothetical protein